MKRIPFLLALVCLVNLFACQGGGADTDSQFVTTRDGRFYRAGQEYRFVGTNFWFGAILASEGQGGDRQRLKKKKALWLV